MGKLWLACLFVLISVGPFGAQIGIVQITVDRSDRLEFSGARECWRSWEYSTRYCDGQCTDSEECRMRTLNNCYKCYLKAGLVC